LRKLDSDGKVDTTQTLHNLNEGLFMLVYLIICLTVSREVEFFLSSILIYLFVF